jgi:hypothetical protein
MSGAGGVSSQRECDAVGILWARGTRRAREAQFFYDSVKLPLAMFAHPAAEALHPIGT